MFRACARAMICPLGKVSHTRGFFNLRALKSGFMWQQTHENRIFYCPKQGFHKEKEGIHMRITPTPSMKQAERMAFLFAMAQIALALGLFWAFKAHLV